MFRILLILPVIFSTLVSTGQDTGKKSFPLEIMVSRTVNFHFQDISMYRSMYPFEVVYNTSGKFLVKDNFNDNLAIGYDVVREEGSTFESLRFREISNGISLQASIVFARFLLVGAGFLYNPGARDRLGYYVNAGLAMSDRQKRFQFHSSFRLGNRMYRLNDFRQDKLFYGVDIGFEYHLCNGFSLLLAAGADRYKNSEAFHLRDWTPRPSITYEEESTNINWIAFSSIGIIYKPFHSDKNETENDQENNESKHVSLSIKEVFSLNMVANSESPYSRDIWREYERDWAGIELSLQGHWVKWITVGTGFQYNFHCDNRWKWYAGISYPLVNKERVKWNLPGIYAGMVRVFSKNDLGRPFNNNDPLLGSSTELSLQLCGNLYFSVSTGIEYQWFRPIEDDNGTWVLTGAYGLKCFL